MRKELLEKFREILLPNENWDSYIEFKVDGDVHEVYDGVGRLRMRWTRKPDGSYLMEQF